MTVFFIFLFIGFVAFKIAAEFYVDSIPFFAALGTPLTVACVISGAVMVLFIIFEAIKKFRNK